ncbi:hypothetical protein [Aliiruegeria lutimaris]|nr:hypothetical protein [Aliiruegeria lutimaris]
MSLHSLYSRMQGFVEKAKIEPPLSRMERQEIGIFEHPQPLHFIARQVAALRSSGTAIAASLEEKGLAGRRRASRDGEVWLLGLTDAGHNTHEHLIERFSKLFRQEVRLTRAEIVSLASMLSRLDTSAREIALPRIDLKGEAQHGTG